MITLESQISELRKLQNSWIKVDNNKIEIDETQIDLFQQIDLDLISEFKPDITLKPYFDVRRIALDIETTGLDGSTCECKMIGISYLDQRDIAGIEHEFFIYGTDTEGLAGYSNIHFFGSEYEMIEAALDFLESLKVDDGIAILEHHNGWCFDFPFLEERCRFWGIKKWNLFWKSPYKTVDSTAQMFGKPIGNYDNPKHVTGYNSYFSKGFEIVDTMHKALSWDFVNRKLTGGVGLKNVVYELDLIHDDRVELEFHQMMAMYARDEWSTLLRYLKDDLKATLILGDFLIPPYYYQLQLLPHWRLQSIFTRGNGSKWNDILLRAYCPNVYREPKKAKTQLEVYSQILESKGIKPDPRHSFVGGKTAGTAGLFYNIGKIDVASLYPSIILNYGICSSKDTAHKLLSILKYCWEERIRQKGLKDVSVDANMMQASLKVLINSGYGALGTNGITFNDYSMAALVTAYGRAILDAMDQAIVEFGGKSIELDTDGIFFTFDGDHSELLAYVQSKMPKGIVLENELFAKGCYIPPVSFDPTKFTENMTLEKYPGMRKNYILVDLKLPKGKIKDIKVSGKFRNRYVPELYRKYVPELITRLVKSGGNCSAALKLIEDYYESYSQAIKLQSIDPNLLMVSRKVKQAKEGAQRDPDGKVREYGCTRIDENGIEVCDYFYGSKRGKKGGYIKQSYPVSTSSYQSNNADIQHYYLKTLKNFTDTVSLFVTGEKVYDRIEQTVLE